jgi:Fe-S-cluster containining protein
MVKVLRFSKFWIKRSLHMKDEWFDRMTEFYKKLDGSFKDKVKPCGECAKCCTTADIPYREIELDYVFEHLFRLGRVDLYEDLCNLQSNWGRDGKTCIFFNRGATGCAIYDVRPYNCRVFGPYMDEKVGLPTDCVYKGASVVVPRDKVQETLPLFMEYHTLASDYVKDVHS